jgi:hypothetical protein
LKKWKEPNVYQLNIGCKDFESLMPPNPDQVKVGDIWDLIPRLKDEKARMQLSNNRHFPPEPSAKEITLFKILQMLHKRPFIFNRFPPQGTSLILRAQNKNYFDIMFR